MPATQVQNVLDREFLRVRSALLDLAAGLDRIDRDPQANPDDARYELIRVALENLLKGEIDRAESVQQVFSIPYQSDWRKSYEL